jgi:hypothetical protein
MEAHCSEQWEKSSGMVVDMGLEGNHQSSQNVVRTPSSSLTREMLR